ncbi:MAG TPA: RidA family protein [Candidatus Acidoferrales bacterium]|nr:RidA family protein [Candidatus Acidoferrales bacterium]
MEREVIEVPGISEVSRSRGVPISAAVRANGFIFVSGTPPIDPATGQFVRGPIHEQAERALRNLAHILETAGSSLEKICMVHVYASGDHYRAINEVYARFFPSNPPARTFVPVGDWPLDFDLEIECVALA